MEATAYSLYFSAFLVVLAVRRNQVSLVPRYCLYGEPPQTADDWFLHFEDLDDRTRPAAWRIRPHAHVDLHQVFRFRHGRGWVTAEEETIAFEGPCVLIVPAGVVHGFSYETSITGHVLTLSDAFLRLLAREEQVFTTVFNAVRILPLQDDHRLDEALDDLGGEQAGAAPGRQTALKAHLTLFLIELTRLLFEQQPSVSPRLPAHAGIVARFRAVIEENYRKNWSLEQYCLQTGISPGRLRTACRVVADATPGQLITERIIREAKRFIHYSDLSVSKIAYELGFQDPAYFSRYFLRSTGLTPSDFRKLVCP